MKKIFPIVLLLLLSCSKPAVNDKTIVGILPYSDINSEKISLLKKSVVDYYGVEIKMLPISELPKDAFVNIKSPRYRADSLIAIQERNMPQEIDYILGLTEKDISVTKHDKDGGIKKPVWRYNDFGIMGLAYCPGKSCIVSGYRLKHRDKEVYFGRFKKVVIHELGHNFGLAHCPDKKCVMTDAVESIKTIDNARPELCNDCKKKLK